QGAGGIKVFGGGGGVIVPDEILELERSGVEKIYSPEDGQTMGLLGMIQDMIDRCKSSSREEQSGFPGNVPALLQSGRDVDLARVLSAIENAQLDPIQEQELLSLQADQPAVVLGITGTGGAGKSSLTDELVQRWLMDYGEPLRIAIIAVDPSRRKSGGALLGDRIRMNAIDVPNVYMRSVATRGAASEVPDHVAGMIQAVKAAGYQLIIIETPGIGQADAGVVSMVDTALYVMTPEFGAASQLEKIDMLDFADVVAINKFDRRGAEDALRDVKKQLQRNRGTFEHPWDEMPVFGTMASHFNDAGVTHLYLHLLVQLHSKNMPASTKKVASALLRAAPPLTLVPASRQRYLAEISSVIREYHQYIAVQSELASDRASLLRSLQLLEGDESTAASIQVALEKITSKLSDNAHTLLQQWPQRRTRYQGQLYTEGEGDKAKTIPLIRTSLSGTSIPRIALPTFAHDGDILSWLLRENLPGSFPFTAGVFPFKRPEEEPTRMFAGEGDAFRTNERFKYLSRHSEAKRLSTAFDSVTLYGSDPAVRPDIYGKVGNSGVSIATLDDMKVLYSGFDLCDPRTSVSMTINGPAPTVLAMFMNVAMDQQLDQFIEQQQRQPDAQELEHIREWTLQQVRGTVQADILKEDQGQNTCLFSTEFSLRLMGDVQEYFVQHQVHHFYSVSISGYHIAEAGANPITQLALTLANGFTYVESYLARGMAIDDFAPNLSFFFSNGMDPEYSVLGRVARRIWAITMRDRYGANLRSQKLKYHIQTSGRSLHAQEMDFNNIRTTLQALIAIYDNCNSLHTNAHDEAVTTPTEESVRQALAIQLIINREWGLAYNENPNQGSFIIEQLTDLVEEAVLQEFERLSERGGVLGAMETGYQRGKIQDESLHYEQQKHDGSLPIVGVNCFLSNKEIATGSVELARSTTEEKERQIQRLQDFQQRHSEQADTVIERLQVAALHNSNVFEVLMEAVRYCSLGQITQALFEVGGKYRRSM
ncbi:MAG TPA: methylmalonyl-CoA mutase, partial [Gammaproteobacteria bacterium]|nr:methylmalonyl-CoA mutase [Gammaproteobacteria bacterium]